MNWRALLKELLPPIAVRVYRKVRKGVRDSREEAPQEFPCDCPVCGQRVAAFLPLPPRYDEKMLEHGYVHSPYLVETMNRRGYKCPHCCATDRDRLYALYLEQQAQERQLPSLLDIAPTQALTEKIKGLCPQAYKTTDLHKQGVDDNLDITDMAKYEDDVFGAIICSHVLEHVPDDRKAMRELYRVLAPGGWAILMVPINLGLNEVFEDPTITDPGLR